MHRNNLFAIALILMILIALTACDTSATGGTPTPASQSGTSGTSATPGTGQSNPQADSYCTSQGGQVVTRYPAYGTNGSNPLRLSGSLQFCQFTAKDSSTISISVDTLYTDQPTLATLAYLQKPPMDTNSSGANPASLYCSKLGGSDQFGGQNAAGGGWVSDDKSNPIQVLETCVFPDLSTIDSWGLTYHSNGTIRGTDLSKVIRYQPTNLPTPGAFTKCPTEHYMPPFSGQSGRARLPASIDPP
jgi:putative hemolysin